MSYNSYSTRRFSGARTGSPMRAYHSRPAQRRGPKKAYIDPARFVKAAKPRHETPYTPAHKFADFDMRPILKENLASIGFTTPTPIQDQTIPQGLAGRDIVGIANTGTGKTLAFALPLLDKLINDHTAKALVMAPTRELAEQIEGECRKIGRNSGLFSALLIGGKPMGPQLKDLRSNPRIIIGTPGRIKDHAERGTLKLGVFNIVVLDEVDRMLDMGFIADIRDILGRTSRQKQSFFFSATMERRVKTIIDEFCANPIYVEAKTGDTSDNVEQNIVAYTSVDQKLEMLHDLLIKEGVGKTLVFDETQRSVERLHLKLQERGFDSDAIHGGKSQGQRQRALRRFKNSEITVLVATDVAARGIDVADITHVINYTTPNSYEDYVHRIGRAGRAGRLGFALTFVEKRY